MADRIAMIAITVRTSIRVKPFERLIVENRFFMWKIVAVVFSGSLVGVIKDCSKVIANGQFFKADWLVLRSNSIGISPPLVVSPMAV